jgi:hypothetical protein
MRTSRTLPTMSGCPGRSRLAVTPFAPIVGDDGEREHEHEHEHLKALLSRSISGFVQVHDPIQVAYREDCDAPG